MARTSAACPATDWLPGFDPEASESTDPSGWTDLFNPAPAQAARGLSVDGTQAIDADSPLDTAPAATRASWRVARPEPIAPSAQVKDDCPALPVHVPCAGVGVAVNDIWALTGIPVIVAAELWTGVKKNLRTHPHQVARLEAFLALFSIPDFTLDAALHYAEIRAALEAKGKTIGPLDLLIAAQARSLGAVLVTANSSEFKRVKGLKIQAWH